VDLPLKFRIFENHKRWQRPPSWKSQKSRYLHNDLTDLYEIWYADAKWVSLPLRPLKNLNFKNPKWRTAAILISVKSPYLFNHLTDFDEIWQNDVHGLLTANRLLKFRIFENPTWWQPPSWKSQKLWYLRDGFNWSLRNLVYWCKMGLLSAAIVKIFEFHKSKKADGRHFENRYIILSLQTFDWFW